MKPDYWGGARPPCWIMGRGAVAPLAPLAPLVPTPLHYGADGNCPLKRRSSRIGTACADKAG